jgi:hypothetical protein
MSRAPNVTIDNLAGISVIVRIVPEPADVLGGDGRNKRDTVGDSRQRLVMSRTVFPLVGVGCTNGCTVSHLLPPTYRTDMMSARRGWRSANSPT